MLGTEFGGKVWLVAPNGTEVIQPPVIQLPNIFQQNVFQHTVSASVDNVALWASWRIRILPRTITCVSHTANNPQCARVSRLTLNGNVADPASKVVLLAGDERLDVDGASWRCDRILR